MKKIIRVGTRGSPLALIQTAEVKEKLLAGNPDSDIELEIVPIRTSGDWSPGQKDRRFLDDGGNKELFTKEIEDALQTHQIDMAVHSMKDVASRLPDSLEIAAILEREDPRDAFISSKAQTLAALPPGAVVGTSSLRRQAQILAQRPDLRVVPLRGNVDTRLKKLAGGAADATLLAVAGLRRLGLADRITSIMDPATMLPAAAQGALGIEIRRGDDDIRRLLAPLNVQAAALCVQAERAAVRILDGSCYTPIGALAQLTDSDQMTLDVLAAKPDGTSLVRLSQSGPVLEAETIGVELGHKIKARLPPDFFAGQG